MVENVRRRDTGKETKQKRTEEIGDKNELQQETKKNLGNYRNFIIA